MKNVNDNVVASVTNLGKCYQLYNKPVERLKQALFRGRRQYYREHWSLRNVSFDIRRGEKVGVIGKNGAGKSTLLQVLAGILPPTEGRIHRVEKFYAILELGTGFNPEFSGRENIYTTGAIMGLSGVRINNLMERMIAFADIGEYIDQPIKTYSTGMFARVAMAVALHLHAELVLIDEILSVGDVFFQNKCFQRLQEMMSEGATALICSHDLGAIRRYCSRVLYLDQGRLVADGPPDEVLSLYLKKYDKETNKPDWAAAKAVPQLSPRQHDYPVDVPAEWQPNEDFRTLIRSPRGVVSLPNGNLLVAELHSHGLFEVTRTGTLLRNWSRKGFGPQELYDPVGLELRHDGSVVTADYSTGKIAACYPDGRIEQLLTDVDVGRQPFLVRYDPDGRPWIFTRADSQLRMRTGPGRIQRIEAFGSGYAIDVLFRNGIAYVIDFQGHRLLMLDAHTTALQRVIGPDRLPRGPHGLAWWGDDLVITCHDDNVLAILPAGAGADEPLVRIDLTAFAVDHPSYLHIVGDRAYIGCTTLGGVLALDLSRWPHSNHHRHSGSHHPQHADLAPLSLP